MARLDVRNRLGMRLVEFDFVLTCDVVRAEGCQESVCMNGGRIGFNLSVHSFKFFGFISADLYCQLQRSMPLQTSISIPSSCIICFIEKLNPYAS